MCTPLWPGRADVESALLVTARDRKFVDSSLIFILFPTPLSHLLFAVHLDLSLPLMIRVLPA